MIEEVATGRRLPAEVSPVTIDDLRSLGKGWKFSWADILREHEAFKLVEARRPDEILGLMSIERHSGGFIKVHELESSPPNVGRGKKHRGIPGHLLAFAARLSFDLGNEGFVQLVAKTALIRHYEKEYGFVRLGKSHVMILESVAATRLIATFHERG